MVIRVVVCVAVSHQTSTFINDLRHIMFVVKPRCVFSLHGGICTTSSW